MQLTEGYKQTEVGVIPEDWNVSTVGQEFHIKLGKMLDSEKNVGVEKPYLGNSSVQWGRIDISNLSKIKLSPSDLQRFRLRKGDLLVCEGGEVGRSAIWQDEIEECYYQKAIHRLRPKRSYNVNYMAAIFETYSRSGYFENYVTKTSIAHLPKDKFETIPIPLPPTKAEQEAIAEALSDTDAWIESLEQLIAKKRRIKAGSMQALLTGKQRLPGFSGDWEVKTLGEIGESLIGLTYSPNEVSESGVLVLRSSNVQNGVLCFENNVFVNRDINERIMVRTGDILICVRNGSRNLIGKCAIIDERANGMTFGAFMCVFRTAFHDFVHYQFQSNVIKQQINEHLGATINQITNGSLNSFKIPFPTEAKEREAIAAILSDMDSELDALESKLSKARQIKQGMMQELLTGKTRLV
ncbi:restriction endonuclease subunit S [Coraliomargarita sp. SDUM461003]|uniref:Restriction endonuclease subunit S n=1 Tax=Thalassobacterium maritimum TaxID=3041265 RepID=A0ABU1AS87_9BACT|nr:restriction endonuclease subunit S [Coraliomargarita sp. SDUM461003]MDQ8206961.1 restriction endonuclease subunit S [Coraliomargarita sp. SDUM461003]